MKIFYRQLLFFFILVNAGIARAQTVPIGSIADDYLRYAQLLGQADPKLSFSLRPIADSLNNYGSVQKGRFWLLPLSWKQQYNTDHPYGWNDGPMIPAKGYQTLVSAGIGFRYGLLSIQLAPEFVYAANPAFPGFIDPSRTAENYTAYYNYFNQIDAPERFGTGPYTKAFWGQSSIRLTYHWLSLGLSTENLWWGPGIQNALILSNNAPGFPHFTLNTTRPVKTPIGYIEGQIIGGRLDPSGYPPLNTNGQAALDALNNPKPADWRYFTGFNINYHPNFIPGLTVGLIRTFDAYEQYVHGFSAYLPFFTPYSKDATAGGAGDPFPRDQYTSLYGRWLFTKAQAEIYFEYGRNDNSYNLRDFTLSPDHSRAYIFGLRKMLPLTGSKAHILFSGEITQLSQSDDRFVRDAEGWYQHGAVRDGQTELGQVLGAGTGSGGNLQTLDLDWVDGIKKLGIGFQRYEHLIDFSNNALLPIDGNSRNWVDFAFALNGRWPVGNLVIDSKIQAIKSLNYEWVLKDYSPEDAYYIPHNTVFNLHLELGITYRF